eukprot:3211892-Ditylum_brightwellii.AAC.1
MSSSQHFHISTSQRYTFKMTDNKSTTNAADQNFNNGFEMPNDAANDIQHRSERESLQGQPLHQQARNVPKPFDNTLSNDPVFRHP